jgi:UDP-glucose 4-epimerase
MGAYLITGGAGFIGSSLAEALLRTGAQVRILDDFSTGRGVNVASLEGIAGAAERLWVVRGSITDAETVASAMADVEVVFHQAAIPSVVRSVENPQSSVHVGVQGTTVVLDVARRTGVRRLIYASSSSVYGDTPTLPKEESMPLRPLSPYAVSKRTGEELLRVFASLYGIETLALRYFNVFGPRQDPASEYAAVIPRFISCALDGREPTVFGDGEQTRDFCFIDNVVQANLAAAHTSARLSGEAVNIACGDRTSLNEVLGHVAAVAVARGDKPAGFAFRPNYMERRPGDIRDSLASVEAARKLFGFEPRVRIREGLERTYDALKAARGAAA